jgi:hypothetical protein
VYDQDISFLVLQPEFLFSTKISESQTLRFLYVLENKTPNSLEYYKNSILTDVRNISTGLSQVNRFSTQRFELGYINNSFSNNFFTFQANANAQYSPLGFLTRNFFDNTLYYSQRSIYKGVKSFQGNLLLQKFIPDISTNVSLDLSTSKSKYYAAIGQAINPYSDINHSLSVTLSTGFKMPVNFASEFRYLKNSTLLADEQINVNNSFKYSLMAKSKLGKRLFHVVSYDLYRLNTRNYQILNSELLYQPQKSLLTYSIQGRNLLDVKTFVNTYISNIVQSTSSTSLLGGYVLLKVSLAIR